MITVQCLEPNTLPLVVALETEMLQRFRMYILSDVRFGMGSSIRSSILLHADEDPPPEAILVAEMDVYDPGAGDPPLFRIRKMGSRCVIDLIRPNVRSRLSEGGEIQHGSRVEIILQDARRILLTMQMESDAFHRSSAVGGGSLKHKEPQGVSSGWFLYNSVFQIITLNGVLVKAWLEKFARRVGFHPYVIAIVLTVGLVIGLSLYAVYSRGQKAQVAQDQVANLEDAQDVLEQSRANALANEMACLEERQALAGRLKDIAEQKRMLAKQALNFGFSQSIAEDIGGKRMVSKPSIPFDEQYQKNTLKTIVSVIDTVGADATDMVFCMEQHPVLGADLPRYLLTWHPDRDLVCPLEYSVIDQGINRMGSWGLSTRVAKEFGAQNLSAGGQTGSQQLAEQLGDPRMAARWSATTLAIGLREVQFTLLTTDTGTRPVVAPSQMHLWSLSLWDAYNRLPSPASGVLDKPVGYCVDELIGKMMKDPEPSVPGQPILPDLTAVAAGEKTIAVSPSPSCPWPTGVFQKSAEAAIQSVANLSVYIDFEMSQETQN
jgi:hypothetical protein